MRSTLRSRYGRITPTQLIVVGYFSSVLLFTFLLHLPISLRPGISISWVDALFTATSSVSVTGLTVVNTAETFSHFGVFLLIFLFQLGGIGIMTLGTFIWILFGRNITLSHRRLIMIDQNRHHLSGLVQMMKIVFLMALLFELVGTIVFSLYFYFSGLVDSWLQAIYYGLFHTVSSYSNAGFDIFGNSMLDFSTDYFVQIATMLLIILGAIGFPVLIEIREYLFGKHKNFRFSLFTKVTVSVFVLLLVIGAIGIFLIEHDLYFADLPLHQKIFHALFQSVTSRSAGLTTMDVTEYSSASQFLTSVLMFTGASPSSAGGGIRTTTFAVILLTLFTYAAGKSEVRIFRRSLKEEDIIKSFVVFAAAVMIVSGSVILLDSIELSNHTLVDIIFEVCSAFGTTGLSLGITPDLSTAGKFIIMTLMFIGRIGILSLLFMMHTEKRKEKFNYPKDDLIIG